jgi:hypothetical protein
VGNFRNESSYRPIIAESEVESERHGFVPDYAA